MNKIRINELQYYQYMHDNVGHMDIVALPVKERITHLSLHLTKYFHAQHDHLRGVDALACVMSMANTLGVGLGDVLSKGTNTHITTIDQIPLIYAGNTHLYQIALREIGAISKLLEGLDHIEPLNYRVELGNMLGNIFHIILHDYAYRTKITNVGENFYRSNLNFINTYFQRLELIRSKHIFHLQFGEKLESDPNFGGFEIRVKHILSSLSQ